jgi:ribosome-dependent ATPase
VAERNAPTLEAAFIGYLEDADPASREPVVLEAVSPEEAATPEDKKSHGSTGKYFSFQRFSCCCWREYLELIRDPIRATLAIFGAILLMLVMGFGISMDVEDLKFAVLDRDGSGLSQSYILNVSGSRYFIIQSPIRDHEDLEARLKSGDLSLAIEIPPNFGKDLEAGKNPEVAFFVDAAMPSRAETVNGYITSLHQQWLEQQVRERHLGKNSSSRFAVQTRYRYNPDVLSLPAMVPAVFWPQLSVLARNGSTISVLIPTRTIKSCSGPLRSRAFREVVLSTWKTVLPELPMIC